MNISGEFEAPLICPVLVSLACACAPNSCRIPISKKTTEVKRKLFIVKEKVEKTLSLRKHLMTLPNDRGVLGLIHSREED